MSEDTIGRHGYMVIEDAFNVGARHRGRLVQSMTAAREEGASFGHAFRAAELAYDLGQKHAMIQALNIYRRIKGSRK